MSATIAGTKGEGARAPLPADPFDLLTDRFFKLAWRYTQFGLSDAEHRRLLRLARLIASWYRVDADDVLEVALEAAEEESP